MYKIFWPWICYNSSYLLNYCIFNDSYGFSNKMHIRLSYLCPFMCLFHLQKHLKCNVFEEVCCICYICCLSALIMVNMFHCHQQCDRMTCCYCIYAYLIVCITTQKPHEPVNFKKKKKNFFFHCKWNLQQQRKRDRQKERKKERKRQRFRMQHGSLRCFGGAM